jgi:hypothetical protein
VTKIMVSERHAWQKKGISALPLKLVGSQASVQGKRSALVHWRYDRETLATRRQKEDELLKLVQGTKGK